MNEENFNPTGLSDTGRQIKNSFSKETESETSIISRLVSELSLPEEAHKEIEDLYDACVIANDIQGNRKETTLSALTYAVTTKHNLPITMKDIADITGVKTRSIGRVYRSLSRKLDIKITPVPAEKYLNRIVDDLRLSQETKDKAKDLVERSKKEASFSGRSRAGIAATSVYLAAKLKDEHRAQKEVSEVIDVTVNTIRSDAKTFRKKLGVEDGN